MTINYNPQHTAQKKPIRPQQQDFFFRYILSGAMPVFFLGLYLKNSMLLKGHADFSFYSSIFGVASIILGVFLMAIVINQIALTVFKRHCHWQVNMAIASLVSFSPYLMNAIMVDYPVRIMITLGSAFFLFAVVLFTNARLSEVHSA